MAPGVVVTTAAQSGSSTPLSANSGQFFVAGLTERGATDAAVLVRGLAEFESKFGGRTPYSFMYDTVRTFFAEGGEQAYVSRVVGPGATRGTLTLVDREDPDPVDTLVVNATSQGNWTEHLELVVAAGTISDTVRVTLLYDGEVVESYNNLASPAAVVNAFRNSQYVRLSDAGSPTAAPDNLPALGTFTLSVGQDDRGNVNGASYEAALGRFVQGLGSGAVAIPGVGETVHSILIDHAVANRRIALLSADVDASSSELMSLAGNLNSDAAGLFAPWVQVPDSAGGGRLLPPEGYVAAVRARAHDQVGPWRVPAGSIAISDTLTGVAVEYGVEEANLLDDAKISVIRRIANTTRLYGWRSLSDDTENWGYLNNRDLLNYLVVSAEEALEDYVFAPVDSKGQLLAAIEGELIGLVEPIRVAGGLYERVADNGTLVDPGYLVETGNTVNTPESLANNEVRARLSVRVSPTGALISLVIVKVGVQAGL